MAVASDILPADLLPTAAALTHTRWGASIYDPRWNLVWVSDELSELLGTDDPDELGLSRNVIEVFALPRWRDSLTPASRAQMLAGNLGFILNDLGGEAPHLRALLDRDGLGELLGPSEPREPPPLWAYSLEYVHGDDPPTHVQAISVRLRDRDGRLLGTAVVYNSGLRAGLINLLARGDRAMYERMVRLAEPGPHAVAILFADLEASSTLSKHSSSAAYFALIQALTRSIDRIVLEHDGIIGRHAGDGVTAFFLAEDCGSPSAAARAAIDAGREITGVAAAAAEIADQTGVQNSELHVNAGAHWGGAVFMGQLVTDGRLEVTALGDEVNECARIQETASGGTLMVSKPLIERLETEDAEALTIDPGTTVYATVAELPGADVKAIRDAGSLPVTRF